MSQPCPAPASRLLPPNPLGNDPESCSDPRDRGFVPSRPFRAAEPHIPRVCRAWEGSSGPQGSFTCYPPPKVFSLTRITTEAPRVTPSQPKRGPLGAEGLHDRPGCGSGPVSPCPGPSPCIPRLSAPSQPGPPGMPRGNPVCLMGEQSGFEGLGQMLGDKKGLFSRGSWGWKLPRGRGCGSCPAPKPAAPSRTGWGAANPIQHQTLPSNTAALSPCSSLCPFAHPDPTGDLRS